MFTCLICSIILCLTLLWLSSPHTYNTMLHNVKGNFTHLNLKAPLFCGQDSRKGRSESLSVSVLIGCFLQKRFRVREGEERAEQVQSQLHGPSIQSIEGLSGFNFIVNPILLCGGGCENLRTFPSIFSV